MKKSSPCRPGQNSKYICFYYYITRTDYRLSYLLRPTSVLDGDLQIHVNTQFRLITKCQMPFSTVAAPLSIYDRPKVWEISSSSMRTNNDWRQSEDEQKITTRDKEFWGFTGTYFRTQQETHQCGLRYSGFGIQLASPFGCQQTVSRRNQQR
jgi:hypothetical protein